MRTFMLFFFAFKDSYQNACWFSRQKKTLSCPEDESIKYRQNTILSNLASFVAASSRSLLATKDELVDSKSPSERESIITIPEGKDLLFKISFQL